MTALTFFNAILLWSLVAGIFMLPGNTLGALIEVVLVAGALSGSSTFCWGFEALASLQSSLVGA